MPRLTWRGFFRRATLAAARPAVRLRPPGPMRTPVLAVGDGALGFWKALTEVFPGTREQRCWVHKPQMCSTPCRSPRSPARPCAPRTRAS